MNHDLLKRYVRAGFQPEACAAALGWPPKRLAKKLLRGWKDLEEESDSPEAALVSWILETESQMLASTLAPLLRVYQQEPSKELGEMIADLQARASAWVTWLERAAQTDADQILRSSAATAATTLRRATEGDGRAQRGVSAANSILDRAGLPARRVIEQVKGVESLTDEELERELQEARRRG